ncbi:MAG: TIGR00730 family Rossman fold protein [Bdellovibrionales bacterium]|nr:TIGR00730 family Rossman fold protein [Bdellovibrionales bacterium]
MTTRSDSKSKYRGPSYHNRTYLDSDEGRPIRILSEYLEPLYRLKNSGVHDTVVFFGSARMKEDGSLGQYYAQAQTLAFELTKWALKEYGHKRFVICSGGGGGIMEAANKGAKEAGGQTIGLNIGLPHEQRPNPYITPELLFEFHYFFMRKFWFSHLAKALVVFPGGFGTIDEMMEMLTLSQTGKIDRKPCILLFGAKYWKEVIHFDVLVKHKMIASDDLKLFHYVDDVPSALRILKTNLPKEIDRNDPAIAKSKTST